MKEGDEITLRLLQVKDASDPDNKFEEKGKLEIKYKMAAKPAEIVDVVNASLKGDNVFNSYYTTNDENAKIHFVFDRELSSEKTPVARLTYGNADNIEVGIYTEDVKGNNEGNTASFDFSGKPRRPIDMLPLSTSATQPDFIHGSFADIYTPDGQRVYTGRHVKSNRIFAFILYKCSSVFHCRRLHSGAGRHLCLDKRWKYGL